VVDGVVEASDGGRRLWEDDVVEARSGGQQISGAPSRPQRSWRLLPTGGVCSAPRRSACRSERINAKWRRGGE
jgi:hypothetical protein